MSLACGIDVGGTKIAGGVVDDTGTILEELRVESPATVEMPKICPAALTARARLVPPPRVPRSVIAPLSTEKAWRAPPATTFDGRVQPLA